MLRPSRGYNNSTEVRIMPRALSKDEGMFSEYPNYKWTIEEGFEQFMRSCRIKNLRPATMDDYQNGYKKFKKFYEEHTPWATQCGNITKRDIEDYILYLRGCDIRDTSVNTYLRNIRTFLNFLFENDACIPFKIPVRKVDKQIKNCYTSEELVKLLQKPNMKIASFAQFRNWVIVNFLLGTGVRAQTLIEVKNKDIDLKNGRIDLRYTKGRKAYIIPLSLRLADILVEYMRTRGGEADDFLFTNDEGKPITSEGLKSAIQRYNVSRGVDKTSIHLFRHTFAKRAVMGGMDVFSLQKMLGHSDLTVSREYVEMFADDLAQSFSTFNPLDNFEFESPQPKTTKIRMKR